MTREAFVRALAAIAAAGLIWIAAGQPLWSMTMRAPQYPKGLRIEAYGSGMTGDLKELNILNHYIGMPPLDPAPAFETRLFPIGIAALGALCLASLGAAGALAAGVELSPDQTVARLGTIRLRKAATLAQADALPEVDAASP